MATKNADTGQKVDESSDSLRVPEPSQASRDPATSRRFARAALPFAGGAAALGAAYWLLHAIMLQSASFLVDPQRGGLRVDGISALRPSEVELVFAPDFGRSIEAVDLSGRLLQLRSLPWVKSASVARVWPRTIAVAVVEREPLAFLRLPVSNAVQLIDADGVILDRRRGGESSLPVLTGIDDAMPIEQRRERIRLFETVMDVFGRTSRDLAEGVSEIDVSDPGNAVVLARHQNRLIKLQMGDRHLQHRLDVFLNYIEAWRSEFGPLEAVDLRFEKQVAVQPVKDKKGSG